MKGVAKEPEGTVNTFRHSAEAFWSLPEPKKPEVFPLPLLHWAEAGDQQHYLH